MLFYELVIDPALFSKDYLLSNEIEKVYLQFILDSVIKQGVIVSLENRSWIDIVEEKLALLNDKNMNEAYIKKQFQVTMKDLIFKNKTITYPTSIESLHWIESTLQMSPLIPFIAFIGNDTDENIETPQGLFQSHKWRNGISTSTQYAIQDNNYIESEIKHIVYNANHLEIIDPHFKLNSDYMKTLSIIVSILEKNICNKNPEVIIHIKNSRDKKIDVSDDLKYLEAWQEELKKYTVAITLKVWKEKKLKMHDRHIVRDENFCITLPAGADERTHNKSAWHIEPDHNIDEIINDHRVDSSDHDLVAEVTKDDQKIWINGILQKNTNLSIEEKLANKKVLTKT